MMQSERKENTAPDFIPTPEVSKDKADVPEEPAATETRQEAKKPSNSSRVSKSRKKTTSSKTAANTSKNRRNQPDNETSSDEDEEEDDTPAPPHKKQKPNSAEKSVESGTTRSTAVNTTPEKPQERGRSPLGRRHYTDSYRPSYPNTLPIARNDQPIAAIHPKPRAKTLGPRISGPVAKIPEVLDTRPQPSAGPSTSGHGQYQRNTSNHGEGNGGWSAPANAPKGPQHPRALINPSSQASGAKTPGYARNNYDNGAKTPGYARHNHHHDGVKTPFYARGNHDDGGFGGRTQGYFPNKSPTQSWGVATPHSGQQPKWNQSGSGGKTPFSQKSATGGTHYRFGE